jgi:hypothetical protein
MRARWYSQGGKGKGKGTGNGGRRETKIENQGSFNVFCLAIAVGGSATTEHCESNYLD